MSTVDDYYFYIAFGSEDCFLMLLSSKKKYGVDTRTTPKESSWSTTCRARAFHGDPRMTTSTRLRSSIVQYSSSLMLLRLASPPATTIVVAAPPWAILLHSSLERKVDALGTSCRIFHKTGMQYATRVLWRNRNGWRFEWENLGFLDTSNCYCQPSGSSQY